MARILAVLAVGLLAGAVQAQNGGGQGSAYTINVTTYSLWTSAWHDYTPVGNGIYAKRSYANVASKFKLAGNFTQAGGYSNLRVHYIVLFDDYTGYNGTAAMTDPPASGTYSLEFDNSQYNPVWQVTVDMEAWTSQGWVSVSGPNTYELYYFN